jgi:hypothetical protein
VDTATLDRAPTTNQKRRAVVSVITALAVLLACALAFNRFTEARANRAPYDAAAVGAAVRMEMAAPGRAQAMADRLAGPGRLIAPQVEPVDGQLPQQVVGQLTFRTPPDAPHDGQYALFVIDRAQNKVVPSVVAIDPAGTQVGQSWDGRFDKVGAKYPWLRMLASIRLPDGSGFTAPGSAVSFPPHTPEPITFVATLDAVSLPITDPSQQLTVALAFIGGNDRVYWATKLAC